MKICGHYILGCTKPGQEGLVGMDFTSIDEAVRVAWELQIPEWSLTGMVNDNLVEICKGSYSKGIEK